MKIWLFIATILVVVGILLFVGVMTANGWDFEALSVNEYETVEKDLTEEFDSIKIKVTTGNVRILPSEDGVCRVSVYQNTKTPHSIKIKDGTIIITEDDERGWLNKFFTVKRQHITVYIPEGTYGNLEINLTTGDVNVPDGFAFDSISIDATTGNIALESSARGDVQLKTTTGDIKISGVSASSFDLKLTTGCTSVNQAECDSFAVRRTTGDVNISDLRCKSFASEGTTGDTTLDSVIARDTLTIEGTTGDVSFDGCDSERINVDLTTGNVKGSFLTDKVIKAETTTGDIDVPTLRDGGLVNVSTTTGSIIIKIEK